MMKGTEFLKIAITAILSMFLTVVVLSSTVINKKANKEYVDKRDQEITIKLDQTVRDFRSQDVQIKADFQREINRANTTLDEVQKDIKKILERI